MLDLDSLWPDFRIMQTCPVFYREVRIRSLVTLLCFRNGIRISSRSLLLWKRWSHGFVLQGSRWNITMMMAFMPLPKRLVSPFVSIGKQPWFLEGNLLGYVCR
ncbi:hypothetical protein LINGRAHAP2_LOCUS5869 [Linum grandiflorum]